MKKQLLFLAIATLCLTGCNKPKDSTNSESSNDLSLPSSDEGPREDYYEVVDEPHDWLDERDTEYTNKLVKPSTVVSNIDELEAIVDYYAFYKVKRFSVTLNNYTYGCGEASIKKEMNYLYWHSELVNGVMGFDAKDIGHNQWEFEYVFYQNAFRNSTPYFEAWKDYSYHVPAKTRADDFDNFATDDESKPLCDVYTTQQLWYAAEHDYCVKPIENSPADIYYKKCKNLLRDIIDDSQSNLLKLSTIYDYIHEYTTYDYSSAYEAPEVSNPQLYPDEYCSGYKCFYIEGFFDNNLLVCDGFAKLYTLLGKMEGCGIVRASGTSDHSNTTREVPGHAYCFIEVEGKWYLSDLTWGQLQTMDDKRSCNYHQYFLAPHQYITPYKSVEWPECHVEDNFTTADQIALVAEPFRNRYVSLLGNRTSCLIESENLQQLTSLCNAVVKNKSYVSFYAYGEDVIQFVENNIDSLTTNFVWRRGDQTFGNIGREYLIMRG